MVRSSVKGTEFGQRYGTVAVRSDCGTEFWNSVNGTGRWLYGTVAVRNSPFGTERMRFVIDYGVRLTVRSGCGTGFYFTVRNSVNGMERLWYGTVAARIESKGMELG